MGKQVKQIKRIAMWSGPRNISTALMRSFENRADTQVVDEPLYAHYLYETGFDHPMRDEIIHSQPVDAAQVVRALADDLPDPNTVSPYYYQKHMVHHLTGKTDIRPLLTSHFHHVFLIRDPRAMVASYVRSRATVTAYDLGYPQMMDLFDRVQTAQGHPPLVINSADILKDPITMLTALCARLDMPLDPAMLSWPAGRRDSDGIWAPHWYSTVEKSTGFTPYNAPDIQLTDTLEQVAAACLPAYQALREKALKA